jgi:MYXO-CTERM domain-containing protein
MALGASLALGVSMVPQSANACGGFFCSQAQGVNQAAERIVFANNDDGTVTAVIEIQYQGPSDKFSWLLPITSVPEGDQIAVASSLSFQRLQTATNPQYSLTTRVEGTCDPGPNLGFGGTGSFGFGGAASSAGGSGSGGPGGVTVEASGVVGSFEWAVISLDQALPEPADAAVEWLGQNGYDVPPGAPGLLGPYLADGLYLLALRLQKGANAGSIRPIVLTYEASRPMIPIKLTAVAANENMGVLTWVLADSQAVPMNYNALELNEARINWFNASANYNAVVTEAADEAGGQGFVTEYAQPTQSLANRMWSASEEQDWLTLESTQAQLTPSQLVVGTMQRYSAWDGFWDVFRKHVELPAGVTVEQVQASPFSAYDFRPTPDYMPALELEVIGPARLLQHLFDAHPQVTRLYSTLSPAEMTVDPLFTYNPDLEPVNNVHTAERVIECGPGYYVSEAPWRIELPQGGVVRGGPTNIGTWPAEFNDLPANRRILRRGETGAGKVLEDNSASIDAGIATYSDSLPTPPHHPPATGGASGATGGATGVGAGSGSSSKPGGGTASNDFTSDDLAATGGCGCRMASERPALGAALALLGLGVSLRRRRRR